MQKLPENIPEEKHSDHDKKSSHENCHSSHESAFSSDETDSDGGHSQKDLSKINP